MRDDSTSSPLIAQIEAEVWRRGGRQRGDEIEFRCPMADSHTHGDQHPSASWNRTKRVWYCQRCGAKGGYVHLAQALGIDLAQAERPSAIYEYRDADGTLSFEVVKYPGKRFTQRRPDGTGGYTYKTGNLDLVYRLPDLLGADHTEPLLVVEGEKDVDRAWDCGFPATTNPNGAGKWRDAHSRLLRGWNCVVIPDNDAPGREHAAAVLRSLRAQGIAAHLLELDGLAEKGDLSDWLEVHDALELAARILAAAAEPTPEPESSNGRGHLYPLRTMQDIPVEPVYWLWRPYIPAGKLTLIEGDPGLGKSWLTLAIAAAVTRGTGPFGMLDPALAAPRWQRVHTQNHDQVGQVGQVGQLGPGRVLLLTAEDGLGDTVRPRLNDFGADCRYILPVEDPAVTLAELEPYAIDWQPALIIVDPLSAFLGSQVDMFRANETRPILSKLAAMAERVGCAVLVLRHITKSPAGRAIYRGQGSIDFAAAARSVLLVGADPEDDSICALVQIKSSLARKGPPIGYRLEEDTFVWTGPSDLTASRILGGTEDTEAPSKLKEAVHFLQEILALGGQRAEAVKAAAKDLDISQSTLRRAREYLHVILTAHARPAGNGIEYWEWELPPSPPP